MCSEKVIMTAKVPQNPGHTESTVWEECRDALVQNFNAEYPGKAIKSVEIQRVNGCVDMGLAYTVAQGIIEYEDMHTPPPIQGYRKLSQSDVDSINQIKQAEQAFLQVLSELTTEADARCKAIAETKVQEASMWACRSIAKPE